jgi:uptake hydrogenase large subunit
MEQGGGLRLAVRWDAAARRIVGVTIDNRRPLAAGILVGRPVSEVAALVPRLFSLCGCAQGVAARLALAAAEGCTAVPGEADLLAVAREAVGEHLWRLLLDWPVLAGGSARRDAFLDWRRRLLAAQDGAASAALGRALRDALPSLAIPGEVESPAAPPLRLLPWRNAVAWAAEGIDVRFAEYPVLDGLPAETGALARCAGSPAVAACLADGRRLAARLYARLADLAMLAETLIEPGRLTGWLDAAPAGDGVGLARVETARGLLLHLMQVKDGRVGGYVIVAPTEWNFHPQGAFTSELAACPAATRDEAAMLARRLALALDPCVAYEVVVEDA